MSRNPKPNELPVPIEDISGVGRALVIDLYLDHTAVNRLLARHADVDLDESIRRDELPGRHLAGLLASYGGTFRGRRGLARDLTRAELVARLARVFEFEVTDGQSSLRKSQAVHILLAIVDGDCAGEIDPPDSITLPSDPDDKGRSQPDVPAIEDAGVGD